MRPGHIVRHEFLHEERRRHRAGKRSAAVRGVGNVAVEHVGIRRPERHPPYRVGRSLGRADSASATSSSLLNIAGRSGPNAVRAAPVSVAKSTIKPGLILDRLGQRIGQHQPPFGIGIVDLDSNPFAAL